MAAIATTIAGASIAVFYNIAFLEKQKDLIYLAKSQARRLAAVTAPGQNPDTTDTIKDAAVAALPLPGQS